MCKPFVVALGFAMAASASAAYAQAAPGRDTPARALLARAKALQAQLKLRDSLAGLERARERRATRFDAGVLTVVLPATVDRVAGHRIASGALAALDDLGAIPRAFVASHVAVSRSAAGVDAVLGAPEFAARATILVDVGPTPDTLTDDWKVAVALGQAYRLTLDAEWQAWLPWSLGLGWKTSREGEAAVRELMGGATRAGGKCLEGDVGECRLWLGLDRDTNPFAVRYRPAELRRRIAGRWFPSGSGARLAKQCTEGSDDACLQFAASGDGLPPIPAGSWTRSSLIRAVRAVHGPDALQRALVDTAGSVGERLARAAHISEDSLVAEWRTWLLTGGGHPHVMADGKAAMPALAFAGLLLFAAARSGRWR